MSHPGACSHKKPHMLSDALYTIEGVVPLSSESQPGPGPWHSGCTLGEEKAVCG